MRLKLFALATVLVASCVTVGCATKPPPVPPPTPGANTVEGLAAAIKAASERSDQESNGKVRSDLAVQAESDANACLALDPHAVACQYGRAIATGMEVQAHPLMAPGLLSSMIQSLDDADAIDPAYENGGPSRVKALLLLRAPSWPVGPGDNDAGLAAARRAVSLKADYPPNVLALAEALSKTGDQAGARDSYAHARDLAQALPASRDRDGWLKTASEGLQKVGAN